MSSSDSKATRSSGCLEKAAARIAAAIDPVAPPSPVWKELSVLMAEYAARLISDSSHPTLYAYLRVRPSATREWIEDVADEQRRREGQMSDDDGGAWRSQIEFAEGLLDPDRRAEYDAWLAAGTLTPRPLSAKEMGCRQFAPACGALKEWHHTTAWRTEPL